MRLARSVVLVLLAALVVVAACGSPSAPAILVYHPDAGRDGTVDAAGDAPADASGDADPTLGGPCVDDAQCNDMIACTYDSCDRTLGRCRNVPDSSQCQDGVYCNGQEQCVIGHGCEPGAVVSCDNGNPCQTGTCVESSQSCVFVTRDVDQDGDPDGRCMGGHDCNDLDPDVSSLHAEVCANGIDDNCNGQVDEMPCVTPKGNTCLTAVQIPGQGTFQLSTLGCNDTFITTCSVSMPKAAQTVVAAITVPAGPNVDLDVWATTTVEVALALETSCGDANSEVACGAGTGATSVRARGYDLAPGVYYAIVVTQNPTTDVELQVSFLPASTYPGNVDCGSAAPITPGAPVTVSVVEPLPTDLASACAAPTGELTYAFTTTQAQDIHVYASTMRGTGTPVVGLRDPHCTDATDELACQQNAAVALFQQDAPPGTYVLTVGGTAPIDVNVDLELAAPTTPTPDETCAAPPVLAANTATTFDLGHHESAIKDGCFPAGPDLAYDLPLSTASDVLLLAQIPQSESGGVSLDAPACNASTQLACTTGDTPLRVSRRNVRAGDWRVVLADQLGLQGTVEAFVRPTTAPVIVAPGQASTCASAIDASNGGFFTGNTSTVPVGAMSGCDAPTQGGEHVQYLALNLATPRRVVLDAEGSAFQTLLDVRQGPSCPGSPVNNGCYVGYTAQRSFLDLELPAGSYWVMMSGYDGASGAWDLDVRVLPP